jgi:hypothetical protein
MSRSMRIAGVTALVVSATSLLACGPEKPKRRLTPDGGYQTQYDSATDHATSPPADGPSMMMMPPDTAPAAKLDAPPATDLPPPMPDLAMTSSDSKPATPDAPASAAVEMGLPPDLAAPADIRPSSDLATCTANTATNGICVPPGKICTTGKQTCTCQQDNRWQCS